MKQKSRLSGRLFIVSECFIESDIASEYSVASEIPLRSRGAARCFSKACDARTGALASRTGALTGG